MPAYTYSCKKCGDVFEIRRSMTEDGAVVCTNCGSKKTARVYQAVAVMAGGSYQGSPTPASFDNQGFQGCGGGSCGCH